MKTNIQMSAALALALTVLASPARAQLNIPSDGSDGALIITSNTVIDLSQAVTGLWSANNAANAGKGIYDSNQWAVVFKYSSVTISNGATLSFYNHGSRAPVVWLVNGDVTIDGSLSLDGQTIGYNAPLLGEPGPGGFRGGMGYYLPGAGSASGFGPGGGVNNYSGGWGGPGYYGYGNPSILPLIGGSGGAGYTSDGRGGSGGGGAILLATSGTLSISGTIHANGGGSRGGTGNGSGGGIRLVSSALTGSGTVQCISGIGSNGDYGIAGGSGRIRIERVTNSGNIQVTPDPSVVPLLANDTPLIWLPTNGPTARIVSIGATNAPNDPRSSFGTYGADVTLPQVATTSVMVETVNAESASVVKVRVMPSANGSYTETTATLTQTNSLNPLVLLWTANVPVNNGYSAVQARLIRP